MQKNKEFFDILILCKVIDNFGDIGVVYRLARSISRIRPELKLAICVSDLISFKKLAPQIDTTALTQDFCSWKIIQWNINEDSTMDFKKNPPKIILECFQCGRPDWLEKILFSDDFESEIFIINIDYLTAEDWADDFHLLKSGTRKKNIHKTIFMPGFSSKTGGILLEEDCVPSDFVTNVLKDKSFFKIIIFSYERDFLSIVQAIKMFSLNTKTKVLIAKSKNSQPFLSAWRIEKKPFEIEELPFLEQKDWDFLLKNVDFAFVRGEDSLARACLAGNPFIWHAYPQKDDWQLVKVDALLERLHSYFASEFLFEKFARFWRFYNGSQEQSDSTKDLLAILQATKENQLKQTFLDFSASIKKNGDLAQNLLRFLEEKSLI